MNMTVGYIREAERSGSLPEKPEPKLEEWSDREFDPDEKER